MTRSIPILLAATALATGVGACGGGEGDSRSGDRAGELRDAGIKFARCMRENGVDMPDPKTDENGVTIANGSDESTGPNGGQPSSRFRAAEQKCREHLKDVKPPQLSPEQAKEFKQRALAHAKCMRDNGVNFPDPRFSEDGGALVDIGPGSGLDPSSPAFQRAQERCRELEGGPGGGGAAAAGGGS